MAVELGYRSTFIDVREDTTSISQRRSRSQPATGLSADGHAAQRGDDTVNDYLATLAQRAERLAEQLLVQSIEAKETCSTASPTSAPPTSSSLQSVAMEETCSTASPTSAPPTSSSLPSMSLEETCSTASPTSAPPTSSSLQSVALEETCSTASPTSAPPTSSSLQSVALEEVLPNPGSAGHPEVCPRACMFLAMGQCSSGASCGYCHMPHREKPLYLDKRQRELVQTLCRAELLAIVTRHLQARAEEKHMLREASEALSIMEDWTLHARSTSTSTSPPSRKALAKLDYFLNKFSFSALLGVALRNSPQDEKVYALQVSEALIRMRSQLAGNC